MKHFTRYFWLVVLVLQACAGDDEQPIAGSRYFPLQKGNFWIYAVEEVIYSPFQATQFLNYELKFAVVDSFQTQTGEYTYVIHRSTRPDESETWTFLDTWSARVNAAQLIVQEGNTAFVKMEFPPALNRSWNGNRLNTLEEDVYRISAFQVPVELENGLVFMNTLTVMQEDEINNVFQDQRQEQYAADVGLIFISRYVIEFDQETFGERIPESGSEYVQRLIAYGKE